MGMFYVEISRGSPLVTATSNYRYHSIDPDCVRILLRFIIFVYLIIDATAHLNSPTSGMVSNLNTPQVPAELTVNELCLEIAGGMS